MPSVEVLNQLKAELAVLKRQVAALEQAIAVFEGSALPGQAKDFRGLGIVEATKRYLEEAREPKSTSEITKALLARGLETKSKKFVATVYSTLDNSKQFQRSGDGRKGRWALRPASGNGDDDESDQ
jgi:hypothetical protein